MIGGGYENVYSNPLLNDVLMPLQHLIVFGSLFINGLILSVIFRRHGQEVGTYRYLISCFAVNDIVYTILHYVTFPVPETFPNVFILRGHGPTFSTFWLSMYMGNYATGFPLLVSHFLYRVLALKWPYILKHFFKLLPFALTVTFICGATWFTSTYIYMEQDEESTAFIHPIFNGEVYSPVIHSPERGKLYVVCVYWTGGTFRGGRVKNFIALALLFVVMFNAYSTRLIEDSFDVPNDETFQTIVPLITAYFPVGICIFAPLVGFAWAPLAIIIPNICCIHPMFDGLVVMLTISEYR
ncbi:hypothetical protein PFISCL1PPCAC_27115, partial [Pristionchus fissidentatus]